MRCHPCGKTIGGAFPTIEALEKHHFAEVIAAMLAPVIREREAEAWDKGAGEALHHVGLTFNRQSELRNHNPYRRSNDE
ncbi:hypothetical protein BLJ79_04205 [Arthrobacter sp. UCD-GKA]|nr:hypothetical protein BLJ79_04205 [Arthrobacter sp. UCD-GKA]